MNVQVPRRVGEESLPSDEALRSCLATALSGAAAGAVEIVDRRRVGHPSTFANEIVTVAVDGGSQRVLCKYDDSAAAHPSFGHRGGVAYEAAVYRGVLSRTQTRTVAYLGDHSDASGHTWLFLEYLDGAVPYAWSPDEHNLALAVGWLGSFQAECERLVAEGELSFLTRYDRAYYVGWVERTLEFTSTLRRSFPWIEAVCTGFVELVDVLVDAPQTVVHGEFYTKNVLVKDDATYPIDWESAAVGPGEIDFATATDGWWEPDVVERGLAEYVARRWPDGTSHDVARRVDLARLYMHFRWFGERADWTAAAGRRRWRFDAAHGVAQRLGLL